MEPKRPASLARMIGAACLAKESLENSPPYNKPGGLPHLAVRALQTGPAGEVTVQP
jgi:hypothetical protein